MRLNNMCYFTNIRKRRLLNILPNNEIGISLKKKISIAMHRNTNPRLSVEELELLASCIGTPYNIDIFKEEIEKEKQKGIDF